MFLPIIQCERVDKKTLVSGFLSYNKPYVIEDGTLLGKVIREGQYFIHEKDYGQSYEVKIETLSISFDNGETWYKDIKLINEILNNSKKIKKECE